MDAAGLLEADLCAAEVIFVATVEMDVDYPTKLAPLTRQREAIWTLMPAPSVQVQLIVDSEKQTYARVPRDGMQKMFRVKAAFELGGLFRVPCVVQAFLYRDKEGQTRLGVFDLLMEGEQSCMEWAGLERHRRLYEIFAPVGDAGVVGIHWCGLRRACENICESDVPFEWRCCIELPAEGDCAIQSVMRQ